MDERDPAVTPGRRNPSGLVPALAIGGAFAALAIGARIALEPIWQSRMPFIFFFPAVLLAVWLAGTEAGVVATLVTGAAAAYRWLPPLNDWRIADPAEIVGLVVYLAVGILISVVTGAQRRARRELENRQGAERAAREAAEATHRQLQLALEAGGLGTWEFDSGSGRVRWSAGLEAMHGYPPGGFAGTFEAFRAEIHPEDLERVLASIDNSIRHGGEHRVEYRIVRRDGTVRWVEGRGQAIREPDGTLRSMVGVCADVTDRRLQDQRFQGAIEACSAAMLIFDAQGSVVYANSFAHRLLGYSPGQLAGLAVERLVPDRWRAIHAGHRAGFLADPRPRPMGAGRELFARREDGSEVPVEIGLSPFTTGGGTFVLAAVTDISERRQLEADRAALLASELEASRRKDEFLAMLSHELRNPLAALRSAAHILASDPAEAALRQKAAGVLDRQIAHLVRLVDDLLDLNRISQGRLELLREPVEVARLIEAAVEASRPAFEERRHTLDIVPPGEPLRVVGDPTRLTQVLANLLLNAAKYTPDGGSVRVEAERRHDSVVMRVRDRGVGMSAATASRLFELFFRGEAADRMAAGMGVGLALSKRIVELHGGSITARSEGPGAGSEFEVALPAAAPPPGSTA